MQLEVTRVPSLLPAVCLIIAGCGPSEQAPEQAGPPRWEIGPEPVLSIGRIEGADPYLFDDIAGVGLFPDGAMAVADDGSSTIRVFGPDGSFRREMGREGEGPGEFAGLESLEVRSPDTIVAFDYESARITRFGRDGELLSTTSLRGHGGFPLLVGRFGDGDAAAAWIRPGAREAETVTPDVMRIGRFGADGALESVLLEEPGMRRTSVPEGTTFGYGPIPFSPHPLSGMIGDTVFYTDGLGGIVTALAPSEDTLRTFRAPFEGWDVGDARSRVEPALDSAQLEDLDRVLEVPGADSIPTISALFADDERGHLWLKRYDPATDSHWLNPRVTDGEWVVTATDGRVLARVTLPSGFRLMEIGRDRIAGVVEDELGVERVHVYRLERE